MMNFCFFFVFFYDPLKKKGTSSKEREKLIDKNRTKSVVVFAQKNKLWKINNGVIHQLEVESHHLSMCCIRQILNVKKRSELT